MSELHSLRPTTKKREDDLHYPKGLSKCPLCGGRAFVMHAVVDGFEFGWSIGCERACIGDKHHKLNDYESFWQAKIVFHNLRSKEYAIEVWERRCREQEQEKINEQQG